MGHYTSKLFANHGETDSKSKSQTHNVSVNSDKHQCTPLMTRRCLPVDPRSATVGIVRTPIQVDSTPPGICKRTASAIPKYLRMKPYLETDIDSVINTLTPVRQIPDPRSPNIACQRTPIIVKSVMDYGNPLEIIDAPPVNSPLDSMNLDPRSPTINFDRTPIMKPRSPENIDKIFHDDVAKCDTESSNVPMLYCETTIDCITPEVQTLPEIISQELRNIGEHLAQCNDTLNDNICKCESLAELSTEESDSEGQITVIPNVNVETSYSQPLNVHDRTNEDSKNEFVDVNTCNSMNIISKSISAPVQNEIASGKIRVWRDSISPTCSADSEVEVFKAPEEIIIEFDDEQSVLKSYNKSDNTAGKIEQNKIINGIFSEKRKKIQQYNKDVKLSHDSGKEFNVSGTIVIDTLKNRTPLGNRSNNHKLSISTKSPQLLRNKAPSAKSKQQENTPPRTKRGRSKNKSNATQWDLDRTVVI